MIGNDIVDLELAAGESNWLRPGWLNKVFTADEQSAIFSAPDPNVMVWLLWSCKEAVYKIVHRYTRIRTYAPLQFNCSPLANLVAHNGRLYPFRSSQTDNCIHTIAVEEEALFDTLEIHLGDADSRQQWDITKDKDGIPDMAGNPVSVSHHGRYAGLVISPKSPSNSLIL